MVQIISIVVCVLSLGMLPSGRAMNPPFIYFFLVAKKWKGLGMYVAQLQRFSSPMNCIYTVLQARLQPNYYVSRVLLRSFEKGPYSVHNILLMFSSYYFFSCAKIFVATNLYHFFQWIFFININDIRIWAEKIPNYTIWIRAI
jgi:hypothetical protein